MTMKKLLLGSAAFAALIAGGPAGAADLHQLRNPQHRLSQRERGYPEFPGQGHQEHPQGWPELLFPMKGGLTPPRAAY